jgi:hypothetical protein
MRMHTQSYLRRSVSGVLKAFQALDFSVNCGSRIL